MKTVEQFVVQDLQPGDIVQSRASGIAYIVTDNHGDFAIAVRTAHVTNPGEWKLVKPNAEHHARSEGRR